MYENERLSSLAARKVARLSCCEGDPHRLELGRVGFVLRAGEDVDFPAPNGFLEARKRQNCVPLCVQQSTGYSTGPEFDVVLDLLGYLPVNDHVGDLDPAAGPQDTV
jgi:hypothetical protein